MAKKCETPTVVILQFCTAIDVSRFLSMTVLPPSYKTSISLLGFQFRLDRYIPKIHIGH